MPLECYEHGCHNPPARGESFCDTHKGRGHRGIFWLRACPLGCDGTTRCKMSTARDVLERPASKVERTIYVTPPERGTCAMFAPAPALRSAS